MAGIKFEDLVAQASQTNGGDAAKLAEKERDLTVTVEKLENQLKQMKSQLAQVKAQLVDPVRQALCAARVLGIEVPAEYSKLQVTSKATSGGEYLWQPGPLPGDTRTVELVSGTMNVARAMWRFSRGSGGSAGKSGEGILSSEEFAALLRNQTDSPDIKPGATVKVTLPNGRELKVTRLKQ